MMRTSGHVLALAAGMALCWSAARGVLAADAAAGPPYGSPDFYPSAERPIGYRGDGNGYFPGATPVTDWWEGTPTQIEINHKDQWGNPKKTKGWDFTDDKSKNIVWKTEMPSYANSQPVVVGDRVLAYAEPDVLACVDANTGKLLWTARVSPWDAAGLDAPLARKLEALADIYCSIPTFTGPIAPNREVVSTFREKCLARVLDGLKKLDPDGGYELLAQKEGEALARFLKELDAPPPADQKDQKKKGRDKELDALLSHLGKRIETLAKMKVRLVNAWGHMVGWCMSVPVSDGQYVYANFGQGQTACYDLAGRRRWVRYHEQHADRCSQIQSPLLSGDILVDMHGGPGVLRGLDKQTGETKWETPTKGGYAFGKGGGYYVGGHKVVRVGEADYIVTALCNIIRAKDGKAVGALPFDFGPSGGPSIVCSGDIVVKSSCGDNYATPVVAYRLKPDGPDKITAEKLWQTADRTCPGYHGQIARDGLLIMTSGAGNVLDIASGQVLVAGGRRGGLGNMSNVLAGNTLMWLPGGSGEPAGSSWGGRRSDGKVLLQASMADLTDPKAPKPIAGSRLLGGRNWPRMPAMEKWAPELYALPGYWGSWSCYGKPGHFVHTDTAWMPLGNRIFLLTVGHLYCLGDPGVPYSWNPASRPERITEQLRAAK